MARMKEAREARAIAKVPAAMRRDHLRDWLVEVAPRLSTVDILKEFSRRLLAEGLPVWRTSLHLRLLHPQLRGASYVWLCDTDEAEEVEREHGVELTPVYLASPVALIYENNASVRVRMDDGLAVNDIPIIEELRLEGTTDYVGMPLYFSDDTINGITLASQRPDGFTTAELLRIASLLPALSLVLELKSSKRKTANLLETYLGRDVGERVLAGTIKRGDYETIRAALWFSDLRGFTAMADTTPPAELIGTLNDYFEVMVAAVHAHGGQVMKFIGDGMLALFPSADQSASCPYACHNALEAANQALEMMETLNAAREKRGSRCLHFGLALHVGEVMYGNIGAPNRLDFTVIGRAVNTVTRLEQLCRRMDRSLLISEAFNEISVTPLISLGSHPLRGMNQPQEVFTLPDRTDTAGPEDAGASN